MYFLLSLFFTIIILFLFVIVAKQQEARNKREKETFLQNKGAPEYCSQFSYLRGHPSITEKQMIYVWRDGKILKLLLPNHDSTEYQILIDNIKYYSIKGDLKIETDVPGNTKKSTTGETIIAEGLFGTAAAMKKNQTVSNIKSIDERRTIINATIDAKECYVFFEKGDLYKYLLEEIPEKEQSFVAMKEKHL